VGGTVDRGGGERGERRRGGDTGGRDAAVAGGVAADGGRGAAVGDGGVGAISEVRLSRPQLQRRHRGRLHLFGRERNGHALAAPVQLKQITIVRRQWVARLAAGQYEAAVVPRSHVDDGSQRGYVVRRRERIERQHGRLVDHVRVAAAGDRA